MQRSQSPLRRLSTSNLQTSHTRDETCAGPHRSDGIERSEERALDVTSSEHLTSTPAAYRLFPGPVSVPSSQRLPTPTLRTGCTASQPTITRRSASLDDLHRDKMLPVPGKPRRTHSRSQDLDVAGFQVPNPRGPQVTDYAPNQPESSDDSRRDRSVSTPEKPVLPTSALQSAKISPLSDTTPIVEQLTRVQQVQRLLARAAEEQRLAAQNAVISHDTQQTPQSDRPSPTGLLDSGSSGRTPQRPIGPGMQNQQHSASPRQHQHSPASYNRDPAGLGISFASNATTPDIAMFPVPGQTNGPRSQSPNIYPRIPPPHSPHGYTTSPRSHSPYGGRMLRPSSPARQYGIRSGSPHIVSPQAQPPAVNTPSPRTNNAEPFFSSPPGLSAKRNIDPKLRVDTEVSKPPKLPNVSAQRQQSEPPRAQERPALLQPVAQDKKAIRKSRLQKPLPAPPPIESLVSAGPGADMSDTSSSWQDSPLQAPSPISPISPISLLERLARSTSMDEPTLGSPVSAMTNVDYDVPPQIPLDAPSVPPIPRSLTRKPLGKDTPSSSGSKSPITPPSSRYQIKRRSSKNDTSNAFAVMMASSRVNTSALPAVPSRNAPSMEPSPNMSISPNPTPSPVQIIEAQTVAIQPVVKEIQMGHEHSAPSLITLSDRHSEHRKRNDKLAPINTSDTSATTVHPDPAWAKSAGGSKAASIMSVPSLFTPFDRSETASPVVSKGNPRPDSDAMGTPPDLRDAQPKLVDIQNELKQEDALRATENAARRPALESDPILATLGSTAVDPSFGNSTSQMATSNATAGARDVPKQTSNLLGPQTSAKPADQRQGDKQLNVHATSSSLDRPILGFRADTAPLLGQASTIVPAALLPPSLGLPRPVRSNTLPQNMAFPKDILLGEASTNTMSSYKNFFMQEPDTAEAEPAAFAFPALPPLQVGTSMTPLSRDFALSRPFASSDKPYASSLRSVRTMPALAETATEHKRQPSASTPLPLFTGHNKAKHSDDSTGAGSERREDSRDETHASPRSNQNQKRYSPGLTGNPVSLADIMAISGPGQSVSTHRPQTSSSNISVASGSSMDRKEQQPSASKYTAYNRTTTRDGPVKNSPLSVVNRMDSVKDIPAELSNPQSGETTTLAKVVENDLNLPAGRDVSKAVVEPARPTTSASERPRMLTKPTQTDTPTEQRPATSGTDQKDRQRAAAPSLSLMPRLQPSRSIETAPTQIGNTFKARPDSQVPPPVPRKDTIRNGLKRILNPKATAAAARGGSLSSIQTDASAPDNGAGNKGTATNSTDSHSSMTSTATRTESVTTSNAELARQLSDKSENSQSIDAIRARVAGISQRTAKAVQPPEQDEKALLAILEDLAKQSEAMHERYAGLRVERQKLSSSITIALKENKAGPEYTTTLLDKHMALSAVTSSLDICFAKLKSLDCRKEEAISALMKIFNRKSTDGGPRSKPTTVVKSTDTPGASSKTTQRNNVSAKSSEVPNGQQARAEDAVHGTTSSATATRRISPPRPQTGVVPEEAADETELSPKGGTAASNSARGPDDNNEKLARTSGRTDSGSRLVVTIDSAKLSKTPPPQRPLPAAPPTKRKSLVNSIHASVISVTSIPEDANTPNDESGPVPFKGPRPGKDARRYAEDDLLDYYRSAP